ncbi:MAG: diguanylate cyclase [Deltaproteobacteria bacterium]|nr:diguanylate cyclase [Deltaproteobacteria bacterium]
MRRIAGHHGYLIAFVALVLIVLRQFDSSRFAGDEPWWNWRLWALVGFLAYLLVRLIWAARPRSSGARGANRHDFDLALLILAATNLVIQLPGDAYRPLFYPLNYLILCLFVIAWGPGLSVAYAVLLGSLEFVQMMAQHRGAMFMPGNPVSADIIDIWLTIASHLAMSLTFVGVVGVFLLGERRQRERAIAKLDRLTTDVDDLAPHGDDELPAVLTDEVTRGGAQYTREFDSELADLMEIGRVGLRADACVTIFLNRDEAFARVRAMSGDPAEMDMEALIPSDSALLSLVLRKAEPIVVGRFDPRRVPLEYRRKRAGVRSLIAVPLMFDGRALGVVVADSARVQAFDATDLEVLGHVSSRVVDAFRAARSMAGISRERSEYATFYALAKKFTDTLTVDDVLATTLEAGRAILPFDGALVAMPVASSSMWSVTAVDQLPSKWIGLEFSESDAQAIRMARDRKILAVRNATQVSSTILFAELRLMRYQSVLALPLEYRGRVEGTVSFFWERPNAFNDYTVRLFESLMILTAVAVNDARLYEQMEQLATTDSLTELTNRRAFNTALTGEIARHERTRAGLSLILLDIDHFKRVNDTYGHPAGDEVLRAVAAAIRGEIRNVDTAARWGGEEFAIVLPSTTPPGARKFAERLRKKIAGLDVPVEGGRRIRVTISLGIAGIPQDAENLGGLVEAADAALYHSKESGRDRVTWASEIG